MQGSSYFRRQATTCLRLSESCTDQGLADRFQAMAEDFMVKAADADTFNEVAVIPLPLVLMRGGPGGGGAVHDLNLLVGCWGGADSAASPIH